MFTFFRWPAPEIDAQLNRLGVMDCPTEWCFYVDSSEPLDAFEMNKLHYLLCDISKPEQCGTLSALEGQEIVEIGPRLNFATAWGTTAVGICRACGLSKVTRIERSRRIAGKQVCEHIAQLCDRMTEEVYPEPLTTFDTGRLPEAVETIPVHEHGLGALAEINQRLGLGWDEEDMRRCLKLFVERMKRDPTDVELFDLGQSNCDHSRHLIWNGRLKFNGQLMPYTLMQIVKMPWQAHPGNSLIAFCDDSSAIRGGEVTVLAPRDPGQPSPYQMMMVVRHPTCTAETHNHPCGISPYGGGATGTGGRIRDGQAVGRGGIPIAGGNGFCVPNLKLPGYDLPWEHESWQAAAHMANSQQMLLGSSKGCFDYGNCYGEPAIYGFTRSFEGCFNGERYGWHKPIVYTIGLGQIDDRHVKKGEPQRGMFIIVIGGPGYRIGVGGSAASSMTAGTNEAKLDFNSVQRGAAEMENRVNRVVRTYIEKGTQNPIISIHDLGAGGVCNGAKELAYPAGAKFFLSQIPIGDPTLSVREIWGNEGQERNVLLIWPSRLPELRGICVSEGCPMAVIAEVTGDGQLVLFDERDGSTPVNMPMEAILGKLPPKTYEFTEVAPQLQPLTLPEGLTVRQALERVLRLLSVGSKRFLTTGVDRSVTGQIAQQQGVGPHHLTLADFACVADSPISMTGAAASIGEQPIKGLINAEALARLGITEAILNLAGMVITKLEDIKFQANWMVAAKAPGEARRVYDASWTMSSFCQQLQIAPDGGKDSSSMAAKLISPKTGETVNVKAPAEFVVGAYARVPDIRVKATPDFKEVGNSVFWLSLNPGQSRMGGSALAQVYEQVGDEAPDVSSAYALKCLFRAVQEMVSSGLVVSVHDVSDGGLITALLEMAFAGNLSLEASFQSEQDVLKLLFAEEPALLVEVANGTAIEFIGKLESYNLKQHYQWVGKVKGPTEPVIVKCNGQEVLREPMHELRAIWEATSTELDKLQAKPCCVKAEARAWRHTFTNPPYHIAFKPVAPNFNRSIRPKIGICRGCGSNGDREMAYAFHLAGFETWDVNIHYLQADEINLDTFQGLAFVGGFSFGDVLDAGRGWAAAIRFDYRLKDEFDRFFARPDTFSLGVCNGCQLMSLLGVLQPDLPETAWPRFVRNESGRFESRFSTVVIKDSPAIMLKGMEGSVLGIWVAHGEGQLYVPQAGVLDDIVKSNLAPIRFANFQGEPTSNYPFNPNGSVFGITALCSPDGRHLAMMPHPERTFQLWQWPWLPRDWQRLESSPWLKMFQNAYDWCLTKHIAHLAT